MEKNNKFIIFKPSKSAMQSGLYNLINGAYFLQILMNFSKVQSLVGMAAQILKKKLNYFLRHLMKQKDLQQKIIIISKLLEPLRRKILKNLILKIL